MSFFTPEAAIAYAKAHQQDYEEFLQSVLLCNKVNTEEISQEEREIIESEDRITMQKFSIFNYPEDWRKRYLTT